MNACRVEIVTHTEGKTSRVVAQGTAAFSCERARVFYRTEGDETVFSFDEEGCAMERNGAVRLRMEFCPARQTQLVLNEGGAGSVPIRTYRYERKINAQSMRLTLGYEVLYPHNRQRFLIKVNVHITEES